MIFFEKLRTIHYTLALQYSESINIQFRDANYIKYFGFGFGLKNRL